MNAAGYSLLIQQLDSRRYRYVCLPLYSRSRE